MTIALINPVKSTTAFAARNTNQTAFRIAIVGCGPKGTYCLDSLCSQLNGSQSRRPFELTIFEPATYCGAGNIYDPDQPRFLRMNFASRKIDAWKRIHPTDYDPDRPSLVEWLEFNYQGLADPDGYVPRAIVGEYLNSCFGFVLQNAKRFGSVNVVHEYVQDLVRVDDVWQIDTKTESRQFDEVLISIGHGGWRPANHITANSRFPIAEPNSTVRSVFPVEKQLGESSVRPGTTVAVCGFALTFIDTALALTEGRGGKFTCESQHWRYHRSGKEPAKILPFSRTNRFMLAKPNDARLNLPRELERVWERGKDELETVAMIDEQVNFSVDLWPIILSAASQALAVVQGTSIVDEEKDRNDIGAWYQQWLDQKPTPATILTQLKHTYRVANGQAALDRGWALGESWRQLYPVLVKRISHGGLTEDDWPEFHCVASEMEKIAFGPPAENVGRMIALIDAGIVDLSLTQVDVSHFDCFASQKANVDVLVDATIASPHRFPAHSFLARLKLQGVLSQSPIARGIKVTPSGQAIDAYGNPVEGLSLIGRPTEGWVLGNDTLSRNLHDHPFAWAKRVAETLVSNQEKIL